jgi:archaeal flagellar protein FlaJ
MAFNIKNFFNRIGNVTVSSGKTVGKTVTKPVNRLNRTNQRKTSSRVIKRTRMDEEEVRIFKELVEKKKNDKNLAEENSEPKASMEYEKASLEAILKEEGQTEVDRRLIFGLGLTSFGIVFIVMFALNFGITLSLVIGGLVLILSVALIFLPSIQKGRKSAEASRELPYALRQMATELAAGIGLHDSMRSVALSGYGPLSEEFARTLEEIKYGETTENALLDMSERLQSDGLKRAVYQITRTLSSGGDLSKTLNIIAEDIAYELRMKLKDYAQKLNSFTMIYMFIAILGPVILMVMALAATTVMGPIFPPFTLLILYLFLFPLIVAFMIFMVKRLEPKL